MARIICKLCGWNVRDQQTGILVGRTAHLKHAHAIAPYDCMGKRAGETPDDGSVRRDRAMTEDGGTGRTAPPTGGIPAIERRKGGTKNE